MWTRARTLKAGLTSSDIPLLDQDLGSLGEFSVHSQSDNTEFDSVGSNSTFDLLDEDTIVHPKIATTAVADELASALKLHTTLKQEGLCRYHCDEKINTVFGDSNLVANHNAGTNCQCRYCQLAVLDSDCQQCRIAMAKLSTPRDSALPRDRLTFGHDVGTPLPRGPVNRVDEDPTLEAGGAGAPAPAQAQPDNMAPLTDADFDLYEERLRRLTQGDGPAAPMLSPGPPILTPHPMPPRTRSLSPTVRATSPIQPVPGRNQQPPPAAGRLYTRHHRGESDFTTWGFYCQRSSKKSAGITN